MLARVSRLFSNKVKVEDGGEERLMTVERDQSSVELLTLPVTENDTRLMPFGPYLGPIVCCTMFIDKVLPTWAILCLLGLGSVRFLQLLWTSRHVWTTNRPYFVRMLVSILLLILWLVTESFCVWAVSASDDRRHWEQRPQFPLGLQDNVREWIQKRWDRESDSAQWFRANQPSVKHFGAVTIFYLVSAAWSQVWLAVLHCTSTPSLSSLADCARGAWPRCLSPCFSSGNASGLPSCLRG